MNLPDWSVNDWLYLTETTQPKVTDGDTIAFQTVKIPFFGDMKPGSLPGGKPLRVRLNGVDTFETSTREGQTRAQTFLGLVSAAYLRRVVKQSDRTFIRTYALDEFGRWLADVYVAERRSNLLLSAAYLLARYPTLAPTDSRSEVAPHVLGGIPRHGDVMFAEYPLEPMDFVPAARVFARRYYRKSAYLRHEGERISQELQTQNLRELLQNLAANLADTAALDCGLLSVRLDGALADSCK